MRKTIRGVVSQDICEHRSEAVAGDKTRVEDGQNVSRRVNGRRNVQQRGGVVKVTRADGSSETFYQTRAQIGKVVNAGQKASPPTLRVQRLERAPIEQGIAPRVRRGVAASDAIEQVRERQRAKYK